MIELKNIKKSYGKKEVLKNVNFFIKKGEICALLGLNGAGKSTLMKIICGLTRYDSGIVLIDNKVIDINNPSKEIGAMIESPEFYNDLTGRQNLEIFRIMCPNIPIGRVSEVLKITGLINNADIKYKKYSLGMKQRLYFAFALMKKPKILLLDEPFSNIDPISIKIFENTIKALAKSGTAVLICGHVIAELKNVCNCAIILDNGKIINYIENIENVDLESVFIESVCQSGEIL